MATYKCIIVGPLFADKALLKSLYFGNNSLSLIPNLLAQQKAGTLEAGKYSVTFTYGNKLVEGQKNVKNSNFDCCGGFLYVLCVLPNDFRQSEVLFELQYGNENVGA